MAMVSVTSFPGADIDARKSTRLPTVSWVLVAVYYFYQYMLRSAPSVVMPQPDSAAAVVLFLLLKETGPGVQHSLAKS
ncbi:MAG: hypothetical protein WBQ10_12200 [Terriglobales bacterium]